MPRAGLTATAITEAAVDLVDERGLAGLTLAEVAQRTGVATPSLYKHVRNLAELRDRIAARVADELTTTLRTAVLGRTREDALRAGMRAYRNYVLAHPNRYAVLPVGMPDQPTLSGSLNRMLGVLLDILRGYRLHGAAAVHAARCFRAAAHGFAALQSAGGFGLPTDLDDSYEQLIDGLVLAIDATTNAAVPKTAVPKTAMPASR